MTRGICLRERKGPTDGQSPPVADHWKRFLEFFSAIIFIFNSLDSVEAGGAGGPLDVRQLLGHQAVDQDLWQDHREHDR